MPTATPSSTPDDKDKQDKPVGAIGETLRTAREKAKLKLSDIEEALRIRQVYLSALESEDFAALPGEAYTTCFLRAYADHLKLDSDMLVDLYRNQHSDGPPSFTPKEDPVSGKKGQPKKSTVILSAVIAVALYGGWIWWQEQASRPASEIEAPASSEPAATDDTATLEPAETVEEATADVSTTPTEEDSASAEPEISEPTDAPVALDALLEEEENEAEAETAVEEEATPDEDVTFAARIDGIPVAPRMASSREKAPVVLILEATDASWVQIRNRRGVTIYSTVMQPGTQYRIPDEPDLRFTTGNAGGLRFIYDGEVKPALGKDSEVLNWRGLGPDLVKKYYAEQADTPSGDAP